MDINRQHLAIAHVLVITILVTFVYSAVRAHYFVWDTIPFVMENPWIHEWSLDNLIAMFTQVHEANWHPVVLISHAIDISLFGYDSGAHHLTNLLLHLLNCLLLYWLICCIATLTNLPPATGQWIAFLSALIFGVHPQHVESVAWVVERKDVLYSLFTLGSFIAYLKARSSSQPTALLRAAPFMLFCLSIAAKPMAVTLPVILVMLDIFPLNRFTWNRAIQLIMEKWHYIAVSLIVVIVTLNTQSMAMPETTALPLWARLLNAIDNTWFYVAHYIWPLNLSPFYPYPQDASLIANASFWWKGTLFLLATATLTGLLLLRGITWPFLLIAFYLVTLLPASGIIHVGPAKATDHYVYLATIPFSILSAIAIVHISSLKPIMKPVMISLTVFYLAFLGVIAKTQVDIWNNPLSLWNRVVIFHPDSPFGHRNIAGAYFDIGNLDAALHHAELSLALGSPDEEFVTRLREAVKKAQQADLPDG